jgi:hypothetical protein
VALGFIGNPELLQAEAALEAKLASFIEQLAGVPA